MSYTPFVWKDGSLGSTPISAARLNAIEQGIASALSSTDVILSPASTGGDDTLLIQNWLNSLPANALAQFRRGTYSFTSMTVPQGIAILGWGVIWKAMAGSGDFVTIASGVEIIGLELDGSARGGTTSNALVTAANSSAQILDNLYVHDWPKGGIAFQNAQDWIIRGCRVTNTVTAGISATFAPRGRIANCTTVNANGIQWWGGDSAQVSTLGISDLVITGNLVINGAIWGSCGSNIVVSGNTVDGAADVGIDFEGCADSVASGNTVRNATNACYSVFYGSRRVSFIGNTAICDASGNTAAGFKAYTSNASYYITVANNTFSLVGGIGVVTDVTALYDSSIRNNRIVVNNSSVQGMRFIDCNNISIVGNELRTNGVIGISWEGGTDSRIESNEIITFTANDASANGSATGGIYLVWRSTNYPIKRNRVRFNTIRAYAQAIFDNCYGDTAAYNIIENNIATKVVMRSGTTSIQNNNRNESNHAIISATVI